MRLNECVQLRTDDVAVREGADVILIREDEDGDKRLKTDASERFVPIHSELKKIGFLTYVTKMRRAGTVRLFPELPKGKRLLQRPLPEMVQSFSHQYRGQDTQNEFSQFSPLLP